MNETAYHLDSDDPGTFRGWCGRGELVLHRRALLRHHAAGVECCPVCVAEAERRLLAELSASAQQDYRPPHSIPEDFYA